MTHPLHALLESVDPDRTLNMATRIADEAMNSFPSPVAQITDWKVFQHYLVRFHKHLEATILGLPAAVTGGFEFDWARCIRVMRQAFGASAEKTAFEIARTGTEGGLHHVLTTLAQAVADEYAQNQVKTQIWRYWNSLSTDEKLTAPAEYLQRYGHLLPAELTEGSAGRIQASFPQVLQEHVRLIQRLRRIGRH